MRASAPPLLLFSSLPLQHQPSSFPPPLPVFSFPLLLPPPSSSSLPQLLHPQPLQHHQQASPPPSSSCSPLCSCPHPWSWGPTAWPSQSPQLPPGTFLSPPSPGLVCQMPEATRQDIKYFKTLPLYF